MNIGRRKFIGLAAGSLPLAASAGCAGPASQPPLDAALLEEAAAAPLLHLESLAEPVVIETIELFTDGRDYFVLSSSTSGAEGIAVTNGRAAYLHPILRELVIPCFLGRDARELEALIDEVYVHDSNYKLSSLALWCCVAWVEFSLLDLLGKLAGKPLGELFGGVVRRQVPVYVASGRRDTSPEQEVALLEELIERTGVSAVKFKVGGRMSHNADSLPGRSEGLIALARKRLGDGITLHADANGSYDPPRAIEIGRRLEDIGAEFYEEPCPFDHLDDTRTVAEALDIPVAGGEQESSQRRFRWMIANRAVQVVQPDLHYYGGMIRSSRVARMAQAAGLPMTLHLSGEGTGYADMLQFCSFTPNTGPYQEYKEGVQESGRWFDPPLTMSAGAISVPTGPGLGTAIDSAFLRGLKKMI